MQNVGQQGRTVLFVSHNMPAVTRLCERAILLEAGLMVKDGSAPEVVRGYLSSEQGTTAVREWARSEVRGGEVSGLCAVRILAEDGRISETMDIRKPVRIEMEYDVWKPGYRLMPFFSLSNEEGVIAFTSNDVDPEWRGRARPPGRYASAVWIPGNFLAEGTMFVTAGLRTINPDLKQFKEKDVVAFQVVDSLDGNSARGDSARRVRGVVRPLFKWTTERKSPAVSEMASPGLHR
jgi:lipopolysaccharide transport system ATP-binding protein